MKENNIHIAFGFHVNCYHSYRGDSNDNLGFGSDIRIINKILDILNDFNEKGIDVKGTWDTENFFSLEKILPEYAPEIIEKMKERVIKYGDENIIMGYNNGALSAMNEDEFCESIRLAVTNPQGSGLKDIFGECAMLVRPQEVMFTPSQVSLYNKLGVDALCLYYSCVPFDAFRTLIPRLDDELAFNPLKYTYKGESMTIIPTYNNSDICDAGCLRAWVKELRKKQVNNKINNDLLIFVNMDADAIFWEPIDLGPISGKIANTDGIRGLVNEVCDLPYVKFDTPGNYIKSHSAIGEIEFTQDTADGNFTGYASWSEKPFNRKIWTSIERARAMAKLNAKKDIDSPSFKDRVLLLSTTHFGLATPVLNIEREKTAISLADSIISSEINNLPKVDKLTIFNINKSTFQGVQLKLNDTLDDLSKLVIKCNDLKDYAVVPMASDNSSVYLLLSFSRYKKKYELDVEINDNSRNNDLNLVLETDDIKIKFSVNGNIYEVSSNGKIIGDSSFLESYITYDNERYDFIKNKAETLNCGGSAKGVKVSGEIHIPNEVKAGSFEYDFFTIKSSNAIFVRSTINYPYTPEHNSISTENSSLGRYTDMKWSEAVPFQITPLFDKNTEIIKRNFMDDISSYKATSFKKSDYKNNKLDSFNHQLTAGIVGLTDKDNALIIANARQVTNSMAHCPMRLDSNGVVHMNPFGTYYGKQRHHWSRSKGQILDTYVLVTPQGKSIAPAYNGNSETQMLALYAQNPFSCDEKVLSQMLSFADGCVAVAPEGSLLAPYYDDNSVIKEASAEIVDESQLMSPVLSGIKGNLSKYITKGSRAIGHIVKEQIKANK